MFKKIMVVSIIGFTFIGQHTGYIEELFKLNYGFGQCVSPWLLAILICVLLCKE